MDLGRWFQIDGNLRTIVSGEASKDFSEIYNEEKYRQLLPPP
jgi:hypothetical protein